MGAKHSESTADSSVSACDRVLAVWDGGAATCTPGLGRLLVGRSNDAGLVVDHPSVSREHAALVLHEDGWTLEDLGSRQGTWLGARRVTKGEVIRGAEGAALRLGDALVFVKRAAGRGRARSESPEASLEETVERIAAGGIPVLILGETGVGKEVLAERIHRASRRRAGPFVRLHCAALPEPLFESELFGHEKGAFTGALQRKLGLLESANGGTVLLDEVGELSSSAQAKLLRVLEQREVLRVGAVRPVALDVRFLSATNRDVEEMVVRGAFRADLYYRLAGFTIVVPPLRERTAEIDSLARRFIREECRHLAMPEPVLGPDALLLLERYAWPGNIRELRNVIECAVLLAAEGVIGEAALPLRVRSPGPTPSMPRVEGPREDSDLGAGLLPDQVARLERQRIIDALDRCGGNQTHAAKLLGIGRRTLIKRLDAYGVVRPRRRLPR